MSFTGWTINGLDVRTLGIEVSEITGWDAWPGLRGTSTPNPYRHGDTTNVRKWYNSRELALSLVVLPRDSAGAVTYSTPAAHVRENLDSIFGSLHSQGLISVIRTETFQNGTQQREALCQAIDAFDVDAGPSILRNLVIRFRMFSPFWRQLPQVSVPGFTSGTIAVGGNAPIHDMVLTFKSGTDMSLTHTASGDSVGISGAVPAAGVRVDVGAGTATNLDTGLPYEGFLTFDLSKPWMMEWPPNVAATALSLAGGGSVDITYYNKWF